MQTFQEYYYCRITESDVLSKDDIKLIVLHALGINTDTANPTDFMATNLSDYDKRKNILQVKVIQNLPNYDNLKKIINVDYGKYTIGTLIDAISQMIDPAKE